MKTLDYLLIAFLMIVILGLVASAHAGPYDSEWNPPPQYDRKYRGELQEIVLPQSQIRKACQWLGGHVARLGCAKIVSKGRCTIIYIDRPYTQPTGAIVQPKSVRRHENGHCNGWRHARDAHTHGSD